MKTTQISEHIWSLRTWMIIPITVWVVVEEDGVTLVDTGMSTMAKGILKFINRLNAGPLKQIVLTHGHPDHVGALKSILHHHPVTVFAHNKEIPYLLGECSYREGKKPVATLIHGGVKTFAHDNDGELHAIGSLKPYFTPGHSPGHVIFYHEQDKVMLAGDLFSSKHGKLRKPLFTPNMKEVLNSSLVVGKLRPKQLEVCHGHSVFNPADQLSDYISEESKKLRTAVVSADGSDKPSSL
ncbi:MBL fold metallo-hydrolase [Cohnella lupini]|uniref:Glyoxylase-like metal-dependent hydrolase (Beta-lactamase superfamily II) n=1 Tax=Cohnella lupini TaxID=1294267 RepID=A0A3D9I2R1_9BACL|nr:MBL fold metallo-hydrolase [Cohnella lupini]RED55941.1 glyoxylase-like metal-dependent hydrolase (beta-lactamase superfamily II) [Cohnella lupini]